LAVFASNRVSHAGPHSASHYLARHPKLETRSEKRVTHITLKYNSKAAYTANAKTLDVPYTLILSNDLELDSKTQSSVESYTCSVPADTFGVV
jgi:uncharacterized protein YueI